MTPGRRPQPEMRPPAEGRHRKVSAPAHTASSGVAEALGRVLEAKRALRVQLGGSENLPSRPLLTSSPSASTFLRESRAAAAPLLPMRARQPNNPITAVRAKRRHAPLVKDAILSLLRGLTAEPIPADASGRPADRLNRQFERSLAGELRRGRQVLLGAGLIALIWAGLVPLSGAVIVAGSLVVQSGVKKVQHPAGGVVSAIFVHNGSKVKAGDELLRLDETSVHSNLQMVARQLDETRLRIARLNAERDGSEPHWPTDMSAELSSAERRRLLASEQDIFAQRRSARGGELQLADSRVQQLKEQILGLEAQRASNRSQMTITAKELENVEKLIKEKLVTMERLTSLQREAARLQGLDGQLSSQIAETRNKVNEARLQGIQTGESFRSEVMRDVNEAEAKEGELIERKTAADDQAKRTVVRAPATGIVQELAVHTIGGVVSAGQIVMAIVPEGDALEIDARLSPDKIDQVHTGQTAHVRLSAFNARTTPELNGVVDTVSADLVHDTASGAGYYEVRVTLPTDEVRRLGALQLVPGMPAEVYLQTGSRTMMSYLFKPMTDQLSSMFRER
jgi:membrane fusion protein, type I secretion system